MENLQGAFMARTITIELDPLSEAALEAVKFAQAEHFQRKGVPFVPSDEQVVRASLIGMQENHRILEAVAAEHGQQPTKN